MPANIDPIYIKEPFIQLCGSVIGSTAQTATNGTGTGVDQIFFANNSPDGVYVYKVILKSISTTAATVARLFYCANTDPTYSAGNTNTIATTTMLAELTLAAFTASNTTASPQYEIPVNMPMQANTRLLMSFGTSTGANTTGFNPLTVAGKY